MLQNQSSAKHAESLPGLIERVTFFNEENGFAVLMVKAKDHRDPVTVLGSLPSVSAGEWVTAEGRWVQDREFGLQFRAEMLNSTASTTKEGIEKYLGSGMVKGIGPIYAKKLVAKFGERIFDVIETQSARLEEIEGIGPKRRQRIKEAWKFRWWFVGLPGGVGLATAKACLKLWIGFPASRCAVNSAGSGPPMRSAILGAYFADDPAKRREFVLASSRLTHRGWQAETAALAVAECAAMTVKINGQLEPAQVISALEKLSFEPEWLKILNAIKVSLESQHSVSDFACSLGLKMAVSGYSLHVVPVALYAWLRHTRNFRTALTSALECGGDTDTVGAILEALAGVSGGKRCIPSEWLNAIWEWPRSRSFMEQIAVRLVEQQASSQPSRAVQYFWPAIFVRNLLFLATVSLHGFRRLAPPY